MAVVIHGQKKKNLSPFVFLFLFQASLLILWSRTQWTRLSIPDYGMSDYREQLKAEFFLRDSVSISWSLLSANLLNLPF